MANDQELRRLHALVAPSVAERLAAKAFILATLAEGPCDQREMRRLWFPDGEPGPDELLELPSGSQPWDAPDHPLIARRRRALAYDQMLAELLATGFVIDEPVLPHVMPFKLQAGSHGSRVTFTKNVSPADRQVRLCTFATSISTPALAEPDVFLRGLDALRLPAQTERCLREGLLSFRRGQHLASLVLLGAVSEGTSYAVAKPLLRRDPRIRRAHGDRSLMALNAALREQVAGNKQVPDRRNVAERLYSFATYMVTIRNFGAHPASNSVAPLEHLFTEEGNAVLISGLHLHLSTWAETIARLVPNRRRA